MMIFNARIIMSRDYIMCWKGIHHLCQYRKSFNEMFI